MSRWFRFYDDSLNEPKALKLSDKTFRIWIGILCIASKNDGSLPSFEDMAIMLRVKPDKLQPELEKLIEAELIDHDDNGLRPHNWDHRQYKTDVTDPTNAERQQRFRNSKRNGAVTVDKTADKRPETEADTENRTEQKESSLRSVDDWPSDFREAFWKLYPRKVGKQGAINELERVRKRGIPWQKLSDAVAAYAATADPQFTKHPKTWLSQGCWDDEPDTRKPNGKNPNSVVVAQDKLIAKIESFGPRPSLVRSGAGENIVRMLPEGGRERPGDLHSGDNGDPGRIPGGGDPARHGPTDGDCT